MTPLETRIAELERGDRLEEAAALAEEHGRVADAMRLWERACNFSRAAAAALAAGDPRAAFDLAARARDEQLEAQAADALRGDPEAAAAAARTASAKGQHLAAARLWSALGDGHAAALEFEAGGAWLSAGRAFDAAGDPKNAARCFDGLLRAEPNHHAARVALGDLLTRHGRLQPAVKTLQAVPAHAPERVDALRILRRCFDALALREAVSDVERELDELGAPERSASIPPPPPTPRAEPEQVLFGRYRVTREVARTATARVLEAVCRISHDRVAVKIFSASSLRDSGRDALRRFEREAVALSQLRHPSILPLYAFLPEGPAVVLPWMAGGSLADLIARGPLSPARAVEITLAVLSALDQAHRRGILHRDVKPGNVLFDEAGAAHLADFGTAHISDSAATVTAGILGTLAYMAPEQRAGAPANIQSDVYGAGALLWHALTGAPPDAGLPPLSRELGEEHLRVARALIGEEGARPADAQAAQAQLRSLPWPREVPEPRADVAVAAVVSSQDHPRLESLGGPLYRDVVLGRTLLVLGSDPGLLERVLCFARADDPSLAAVLAHRPESSTLWVEDVPAAPCASLTDDEYHELRRALDALHRAGGVHGRVDREHVARQGDRMLLRFPLEPLHHELVRDYADLERLRSALTAPVHQGNH